jgi:hypothetical protein
LKPNPSPLEEQTVLFASKSPVGCSFVLGLSIFFFLSRHDASDKGRSDTSVRVRNLQLGISTFWSLEKFESKLAAMKELYEVCDIKICKIKKQNKFVCVVCLHECLLSMCTTCVPRTLRGQKRVSDPLEWSSKGL